MTKDNKIIWISKLEKFQIMILIEALPNELLNFYASKLTIIHRRLIKYYIRKS